MVLLALVLVAGDPLPPPPSLLHTATARLSTACRAPTCADARPSPYRVADDPAEDRDLKVRAVADDGRRCQVIGSRLCTRAPRTWLKADLLP